MSVSFPNLSWWLWSGKKKDAKLDRVAIGGTRGNLASNLRKSNSREERKIDKEHDAVIVSSDGGFSSEFDSDVSDWSIGWSEPHASGFLSDDEIDAGFGVLVPTYGGKQNARKQNAKKQNAVKDFSDNYANLPELFSADSKKYMEQWLSSLKQN